MIYLTRDLVSRIEAHVKQMKLQPELIGGLLNQIDSHCPEKERPVDEKLLVCMKFIHV